MLFTRRTYYLLLLTALLVAGATWSRPMLWVAAAYLGLVSVMVLTDYLASPGPEQFRVRRVHDSKLSLGVDNAVHISIENRSPRPVQFTLRDEPPYQFVLDRAILEGHVEPRGTAAVRYHVRPLRRGDYRFGDVNLRYRGVLGLVVRQAAYPAAVGVKVYPNLLGIRQYDLLVRKGRLFELGLRPTRIFGEGTEFERLREYVADDEYRRINWKATARRGKPISMEFQTERSQNIVSVVDVGRMMRTPVAELARLDYVVNTVLMLAYVASRKGDRVGLMTFADRVEHFLAPRQGRGQFYRMLEALYSVESRPVEPDYARAIGYLALKNRKRSLVVLFTDLSGGEASRILVAHLATLWPRHLPLCVTISDPNLTGLAAQPPRDSAAVYQRVVAERLLDERRLILDTLNRRGVLTLDVPAQQLTVAVVNKYLELKARTLI